MLKPGVKAFRSRPVYNLYVQNLSIALILCWIDFSQKTIFMKF